MKKTTITAKKPEAQEQQRHTFTLDDSTFASNPGNITFNPFIWMKYDLKKVTGLALFIIISLVLTLGLSYYFVILLIGSLVVNFFYWMGRKEHYMADSNGGIVVSTDPPLVAAVFTDLANDYAEYPVVKIIEYKVKKPNLKIGDRIATVAIYMVSEDDNGDDEYDHWGDFFPLPIEYATKNPSELQSALASYDKEYWRELINGITQVPKPYRLGLYKINIETSGWKDFY